ncbi:type II toxin-antitoxin system HicB family antitoxin [Acetobacterium wieringae]|uniref:Type II toxin-antitoxin system HicB family antitoxin n=1 Tax=Acetobacterium wieringae TaxID=52694 RepID=A0ABY6HDX9_9FIRM|nr:type II toxin-antitoxin system HicB family antitoxin [Acetobacterium wieringae]UYO61816.1 type II toxin-antitoxin system HicB family antitoxin [Acetobacterium wieringae]
MAEKTITIRINEELHKDIKVHIAKRGISLKDYLLELIEKDLYGEVDKK